MLNVKQGRSPLTLLITLVAAVSLAFAAGCEKPEAEAPEQAAPGAQQEAEQAPTPSAGAQDEPSEPAAERAPQQQPRPQQAKGPQQGQKPQQGQQQGQPPQPGQQGGEELSDEAIENYVSVRPKVRDIQTDLQEKMNSVEQPSEAKELQQEARERISKQLAEAGLSSQDYIEIETRLRRDPEFRRELEAKMESPN